MPMRLSVGLSRKLGLPDYSSIGANSQLELELDQALFQGDLEGFRQQIRQMYSACTEAIHEELARQLGSSSAAAALARPAAAAGAPHTSLNGHGNGNGNGNGNGHAAEGHGNGHAATAVNGARRATASQVRAIYGIAGRLRLDIAGRLRKQFQIERPEDLSLADASELIDDLKACAAGGDRP